RSRRRGWSWCSARNHEGHQEEKATTKKDQGKPRSKVQTLAFLGISWPCLVVALGISWSFLVVAGLLRGWRHQRHHQSEGGPRDDDGNDRADCEHHHAADHVDHDAPSTFFYRRVVEREQWRRMTAARDQRVSCTIFTLTVALPMSALLRKLSL